MTSWRDSTSQQTQDDLDELLGIVLPFAQDRLAAHGEFFPFGAARGIDGEDRLLAADPALGQHPASQVVLDTLLAGAKSDADNIRALARVADVMANGSDAIRVELEHRDRVALTVLLPYKRNRFTKRVTYRGLSAQEGNLRVWA